METNNKQIAKRTSNGWQRPRQRLLGKSNVRMLIVTVATCACYIYFVHQPARKSRDAVQAELDAVQLELADANTLPFRLASAIERRDAAREYVANWRHASPSSARAASFGAVVAQIIADAGAQTDRLNPENEVQFEAIGQVPITVEFDAYFGQACEVIAQLEQREECIWIDELQLDVREAQSNPRLHCMLRLGVFTDNSKNSD